MHRPSGGAITTTSNEGTLRADVKIGFNRGLTRRMVGVRPTINSMQSRGRATRVELSEVSKPIKGVDVEDETLSRGTELSLDRGMIEAARELDCSSAYIRLREPCKSEDKAELREQRRRKKENREKKRENQEKKENDPRRELFDALS
ncbi:hypothetical protein B296_00022043 [Ensete ventricosum]|uniref:Uncharacterized protein n=1 Tax=Ensete ventricosum TaxID=4639 RepID=A0A427AUG0_ENSVE|nr:hypothetical protein B296_00022043 [Ensete ventricosum]